MKRYIYKKKRERIINLFVCGAEIKIIFSEITLRA